MTYDDDLLATEMTDASTNVAPYEDDVDDLAVDENEDSVLEEGRRLLATAEARLAAVERALERLDAGAYGSCEICGAQIAPAALTEQPSLSRCAEHVGHKA